MARLLGLDIGTRRTGVAHYEDEVGFPLAQETIVHDSFNALEQAVLSVVAGRAIDRVIVGLPLLPSGQEGTQAALVRSFAANLSKHGINISFVDERYTTPHVHAVDGDAAAACELLSLFIRQENFRQ